LFLFPSRSETFGNVTLEAMASGLATVAFDYGAAREYLRTDENGIAVSDDSEFVTAAVQLAGDDTLRHRLGRNAATAMKRLHPQHVVAEFDALLSELAHARRAHADHAA
ncbi:glycosyltransferase, partial [Leclercia adecarboxylata]|uniref:glycosyltransferase n=2 Tax=Gammaproteobacteria TaxID=1236 RepID=UPI00234CD550